MAYDLKYQSNFYNYFKKLCSVKIYKDGYGVHDTIYIRTKAVVLTVNYQGENIPVIGAGAKVVFVNQGSFNDYDDLLTSYEKQFLCVIEWDSQIVFEGFSVCDLNEQQLLPFAEITLQFTNYIRKLDSNYLTLLNTIDGRNDLLSIVQDALAITELEYDIFVNSTLFENSMDDNDGNTFLPQTYLENSIFYQNLDEYDDTYTVLNKLLLSFGAFLYAYGQKWIIERLENVGRIGDWVYYELASLSGKVTDSLRQSINKQDGDFRYTESSQNLSYDSGIHTLIIDIVDKLFETLVFNNFDADTILTVPDGDPAAGELVAKTWYVNETEESTFDSGILYKDIQRWFYWFGGGYGVGANRGMYYLFSVQRAATLGGITNLTVEYKMERPTGFAAGFGVVTGRFFLRVNSGIAADEYVIKTTLGFDLSATPTVLEVDCSISDDSDIVTVSMIIDIEDIATGLGLDLGGIQDFIIGFLPFSYTLAGSGTVYYNPFNYIGDFKIVCNPVAIDNEIKTVLNENFIKEESVSLTLFDVNDLNYINGLSLSDGSRTTAWDSEGDSVYESLVNIYIKHKFKKYSRTVRILTATILCDKFLKPFTILTDDNITEESSSEPIDFLITGYNWDLVNGTYSIAAEEYPDEEITISE